MKKMLSHTPFHNKGDSLIDFPREKIYDEIDKLFEWAKEVCKTKKMFIFVYYSGHGFLITDLRQKNKCEL